jgi:hypothetical protein
MPAGGRTERATLLTEKSLESPKTCQFHWQVFEMGELQKMVRLEINSCANSADDNSDGSSGDDPDNSCWSTLVGRPRRRRL